MHIPNEMLNGALCSLSATVAVGGIAVAVHAARKASSKPTAGRFAAVAAMIFAAQMLNFAVADGTSGHVLGGVLASVLLGVPFGVLALALVVTLQALVFADGGILVLGANLFNMALLGAGVGGLLHAALSRTALGRHGALLLASWVSVMLAAAACSFELALSGTIEASKVLPAMLGIHAQIGIGEALATLALVWLFDSAPAKAGRWNMTAPALGALVMAALLSPFASSHPDGFERVAAQFEMLKTGEALFVSPLADYVLPAISHAQWSTAVAGVLGVVMVLLMGSVLGRSLQGKTI